MREEEKHVGELKIGVLGLGHVGLPTALGLAELGWKVQGADDDAKRVRHIAEGKTPFYEPGMADLLAKHLNGGRFQPSADVDAVIRNATVLFICVGTPQHPDGTADLSQVEAVARTIARNLNGYKLIVEKSTVPVVTAQWVERTIRRYARRKAEAIQEAESIGGTSGRDQDRAWLRFEVASNPEFLQEGKALHDFFFPDRIVCGVGSERARDILQAIYRPLHRPVFFTDRNTAELIKHAANAFLATKISFINMVGDLCEAVGADITQVARGMGMDARIGPQFLNAGIGFGGYCLPKDVRAFLRLARDHGQEFSLLEEVENINRRRIDRFLQKVQKALWVVAGKRIGILGLAFKPGTDDIREAPSIEVIRRLKQAGACLRLHDPQAMPPMRQLFPPEERVIYCATPYEAAEAAEALLILTEWEEFRDLDWEHIRGLMELPVVVDGRNLLSPRDMEEAGFEYWSVGRAEPGSRFEARRPGSGEKAAAAPLARLVPARPTSVPRSVVTGGAGFVGSHVCERLLAEGHEVVCLDNLLTGKRENIEHLLESSRFAFLPVDVTDGVEMQTAVRNFLAGRNGTGTRPAGIDYVLHLASPASPRDYLQYPLQTLQAGSEGTRHALELARAFGSVFLLASSSEVYGDPEVSPQPEDYWGCVNPHGPRSVYDEAKRFAEALAMAYARVHGVRVRVARIFNTYGERMRREDGRVVPNFIAQALQNRPLTVYGDGSQTRSLCHVSDLVEGLYRLLLSNETNPVNLGNPEEISVLHLAREIVELAESKSPIVFRPLPTDDPRRRCPDIRKAKQVLGWAPKISRREGLRALISYFQAQQERECVAANAESDR
ncbi:MAG TPA: nucleotide sugar dehydrogenase [Terriglobia bacterium]|nr:nucleotide sugar dehydrogenase [Terriglobia bacterium]